MPSSRLSPRHRPQQSQKSPKNDNKLFLRRKGAKSTSSTSTITRRNCLIGFGIVTAVLFIGCQLAIVIYILPVATHTGHAALQPQAGQQSSQIDFSAFNLRPLMGYYINNNPTKEEKPDQDQITLEDPSNSHHHNAGTNNIVDDHQLWPDSILSNLLQTLDPSSHLILGNFITPDPKHFRVPPKKKNNKDKAKFRTEQEDVALLTHLDTKKLPNLDVQMEYWGSREGAPVDVAMYLQTPEDIAKFGTFVRRQYADTTTTKNSRTTFHILLEKNTTDLAYPHNRLRNMLLHYSRYNYFVALDVDFIPTRNAYQLLEKLIFDEDTKTANGDNGSSIRELLHRHSVFVLPSFHIEPKNGTLFATPDMLPQSRQELIEGYHNNTVSDYMKRRLSHGATGYYHWTKVKQLYYKISNPNKFFEPYVLGYRRGIPNYWEEFRGFGFNKQSWCWELIMAGYQYYALRDLYLVHLNHPLSKRQLHSRHMNKPIWEDFGDYLSERYNSTESAA